MTRIALAAFSLLALSGAAMAGEGRGNPFEQSLPGATRTVSVGVILRSVESPRVPAFAQLLPSNDSMSAVQTRNSLPVRTN